MTEAVSPSSPGSLRVDVARYLSATLHLPVRVEALSDTKHLPVFISGRYSVWACRMGSHRLVLLAARNGLSGPSELARHVALVGAATGGVAGFAATALRPHQRARLIARRVPFVVPGNQMYLPDLGLDLRERFRPVAPPRGTDGALSPAAQAVLFRHLLEPRRATLTPTRLTGCLNYSAMSLGRAFDELAAAGLASVARTGKEKRLAFAAAPRDLFAEALPRLRSPVRAVKHLRGTPATVPLRLAGLSALARLTDLAEPDEPTFAVAALRWRRLCDAGGWIETAEDDADFRVETWFYDPAGLSASDVVDRLSLHLRFRGDPDERVAAAAEYLLEPIF